MTTATTTKLTIGDAVRNLNDNACTECGRKIGKNPWYVHVNTSGIIIAPNADDANSQGCWPVGSECAKKFDSAVLQKLDF